MGKNPGRKERRQTARLAAKKPNKQYRLAEGKSTDGQKKMMGLTKKV